MKILKENEGNLLNIEVLALLQQKGADNLDVLQTGERPTSEKDVYQYLCKHSPADLEENELKDLIKEIKELGLHKKEAVELLNFVPSAEVEVYLKVTDCETRLGEEKINVLFNLLKEKLHIIDNKKNSGEQEDDRMEGVEEQQQEDDQMDVAE
eukprot:TRINITY_DN2797_c0_g1_i1.p8 TRINITY_DN2797_c0_g1~~TRINITY_DN2797_c0_g1_i1.p8  ORF type:complete len:153 (-),score=37.35 TRINITY_DN2797_c0_g1_i1:438-896(-)